MTPEQLDNYLAVMRKNGLQAGAMEYVDDEGEAVKMSFHFEPKMPDETSAPGGWKAPMPGSAMPNDLHTRGLDEPQLPEVE